MGLILDFGIEKRKRSRNRIRRRRGRRLDAIDAVDIYKRTLTHVAECAPVVLEIPKSFDLAADRCPQIFRDEKTGANIGLEVQQIHPTSRINTSGKCSPSQEQMDLLLNHTWLERRLYDVVKKKVEDAVNNTLTLNTHIQLNISQLQSS